jgi:hypothetical protein
VGTSDVTSVQELLLSHTMQPTRQTRSKIVNPSFKRGRHQTSVWSSTRHAMSTYVGDEIRAFATIRDIALAEAEKMTDGLNLERARIANEFVEDALKSANRSYESQHLEHGDANRERQRCKAVKLRFSLLHAHLAASSREQAHAA